VKLMTAFFQASSREKHEELALEWPAAEKSPDGSVAATAIRLILKDEPFQSDGLPNALLSAAVESSCVQQAALFDATMFLVSGPTSIGCSIASAAITRSASPTTALRLHSTAEKGHGGSRARSADQGRLAERDMRRGPCRGGRRRAARKRWS
jgi:hypothetical protein